MTLEEAREKELLFTAAGIILRREGYEKVAAIADDYSDFYHDLIEILQKYRREAI